MNLKQKLLEVFKAGATLTSRAALGEGSSGQARLERIDKKLDKKYHDTSYPDKKYDALSTMRQRLLKREKHRSPKRLKYFDKRDKKVSEGSLGYKRMLRKKWSANTDIQKQAGQSKITHRNAARFFRKAHSPADDAYAFKINQGDRNAKKLGFEAAKALVKKPDHVKDSGTYPKVARKKMKRSGTMANPAKPKEKK